jgi:hypothetical protein
LNQFGEGELGETWRRIYRIDQWSDFQSSSLTFSSRLMVKPEYRGSAVLAGLLNAVYEYGRNHGSRFDFCQCAPALVSLYEQLGYRRYTDGYMDEELGYRVPMVLMTEDNDHLRFVRSPFYRVARNYPTERSAREWFLAKFPEHSIHVNQRIVDADAFWQLMEDRLHSRPVDAIPLLNDVEEADAQAFLKTGTVLPVKQGETVLRPGDIGDEMFIILSGVVEVMGQKDGRSYSLAVLGRGEVFGEMAFVSRTRRTARVRAVTDIELLILTQGFLKRAMRNLPETTARILFNLSVTLCNRLRQTTLNWMEVHRTIDDEELVDNL